MEKSILTEFRLTALERGLQLYGVKVFQKGNGSVKNLWRDSKKVCLYSTSKAFTSVAVGICADEGLLKLTDSVLSFFPEYAPIAQKGVEAATIRDLLHMSTGHEVFWCGNYDKMRNGTENADYAELFFRQPLEKKPGESFCYCNSAPYLLSRIVERVSGAKTQRDFLVEKLFGPLKIENPQWNTCPHGHTMGQSMLYLDLEELSRFGQMLLQEGVYEDRQVVSAEYIGKMHTDIVPTRNIYSKNAIPSNTFPHPQFQQGYGYLVWMCNAPGVWRTNGLYGQMAVIIPNKEAVVTVTAHAKDGEGAILDAIFEDILPRL